MIDQLRLLPEGIALPLDPEFSAVIAEIRAQHQLLSSWSPSLLLNQYYRETSTLWRVGDFLLLRLKRSESPLPMANSATKDFLWGRGCDDQLAEIMKISRSPFFRVDPHTLRHLMKHQNQPNLSVPIPDNGLDNYLYDSHEQTALEGRPFARRRSYLSAGRRSAPPLEAELLNLADATVKQKIWGVATGWADDRENAPTVAEELQILRGVLGSPSIGMRACGIVEAKHLVGFAIFEQLENEILAHHLKSRRDGATYATTWQNMFTLAAESGITVVNGGFDGGVIGLRQSKRNLKPSGYIHCYVLRWAHGLRP